MRTVEYYCDVLCYLTGGVLPAKSMCKDEAEFHVRIEGKYHIVDFLLENPQGNETYWTSVYRIMPDNSHKLMVLTHKTTVKFMATGDMKHLVSCVVSFPPPDAPQTKQLDSVLQTFLDYSKKDPELMMKFKCEDGSINAVIAIMSSRSPVIDSMMKMDCVEARTKVVKIEDFPSVVIKKMVEFCETNHIKDPKGCEMELYQAADKYDIEPMKEYVSPKLIGSINKQNVVKLFQFSTTFDFEELEERCLEFSLTHLREVNKLAKVDDLSSRDLKKFWIAVKEYQFSPDDENESPDESME